MSMISTGFLLGNSTDLQRAPTSFGENVQHGSFLIVGLAIWAGAATFGFLATAALLAYVAKRGASRRPKESQPEFVICTRDEGQPEVTRL